MPAGNGGSVVNGNRNIASYFTKVNKPEDEAMKDVTASDDEDARCKLITEVTTTDGDPTNLSESEPSDTPNVPKANVEVKKASRAPGASSNRAFMSSEKSPLASQLPPIHSIPEMYRDIVARLPELTAFAKKIEGRPLRVATMCSGTESPLLALGLFSRFLKEDEHVDFRIQHVFSCEIEPFKQAYIERNFSPPILFRDVCELGEEYAYVESCYLVYSGLLSYRTTAYGAKVKVPGDVDVLVAGTSCVDYSTLNNSQQDIDANGESGRTFRGMLSWVSRHRPVVVILENVCSAPWDRVVEKFAKVDYSAKHIRLDTKNYYIPHTRSRGYLMAVNGRRHSQWPGRWSEKVNQMARPASSTLDAFLLPADDPRIHVARQKLVHEALTHERKSGYDWGKCESRHQKARHEELLGNRRPLTGWEEGK